MKHRGEGEDVRLRLERGSPRAAQALEVAEASERMAERGDIFSLVDPSLHHLLQDSDPNIVAYLKKLQSDDGLAVPWDAEAIAEIFNGDDAAVAPATEALAVPVQRISDAVTEEQEAAAREVTERQAKEEQRRGAMPRQRVLREDSERLLKEAAKSASGPVGRAAVDCDETLFDATVNACGEDLVEEGAASADIFEPGSMVKDVLEAAEALSDADEEEFARLLAGVGGAPAGAREAAGTDEGLREPRVDAAEDAEDASGGAGGAIPQKTYPDNVVDALERFKDGDLAG